MAQQTVTFSELTHALQLDPWWGFCGPESKATNAERVVAELEKTESPRVQGFLNYWAAQPSKGKDFLHAKLIRLLCVAAHLPAYGDTEEALKPEPQPLDWRPHDYARRWSEEGAAIRLDELRATLEAAYLPLPILIFDQPGFTSLTKALHTWFERPISELPFGLRLRVETHFAPLLWDEMNAEQRRKSAIEWDYQHDPATKVERDLWFDLQDERQKLEHTLQTQMASQELNIIDSSGKERRIADARARLDEIDQEMKTLERAREISLCGNSVGYIALNEAFNLLAGEPEGTVMRSYHPLRRLWDHALSEKSKGKFPVSQCRRGDERLVCLEELIEWATYKASPDLKIYTPTNLTEERQFREREQDYDARDAHLSRIDGLLARFERLGLYSLPQDGDQKDSNTVGESGAPGEALAVFRAMDGLRFKEIALKFDPDNLMIRVEAREKFTSVPLHTLGLTHSNRIHLTVQGEAFKAIARKEYDPTDKTARRRIRRLAKHLKEAFCIKDPPFVKGIPQFSISIPKDRRAREKAERLSISYDAAQAPQTGHDGSDWLRRNDPEYDPSDPTYSEEGG